MPCRGGRHACMAQPGSCRGTTHAKVARWRDRPPTPSTPLAAHPPAPPPARPVRCMAQSTRAPAPPPPHTCTRAWPQQRWHSVVIDQPPHGGMLIEVASVHVCRSPNPGGSFKLAQPVHCVDAKPQNPRPETSGHDMLTRLCFHHWSARLPPPPPSDVLLPSKTSVN